MLTLLIGLLLRLCVSLHFYSGQNKPPMFGDYEAQRHWMEVTYNLPTEEWYFNSSNNDLMYWGLDYPPLTAYHSLLCGKIAATLNASYVQLHQSRGFESESHKYFMRFSVIIADLITFIPAVFLFYSQNKNINFPKIKEYSLSSSDSKNFYYLLSLIYPGIILIDHGHFQYNCVSLGFFVFAVVAITNDRHFLGSFLFCLAILYKQMELYHALPFFFYILGNCFSVAKSQGVSKALFRLFCVSFVVILTFMVVCFPFITTTNKALQLITRLFPIARGVFEDKVANMWCVVNIFFKLKSIASNENMAKVCAVTTFLSIIPSSFDLLRNNFHLKFKYSLVNSALSFFLFSYQVHEKSILLVAIPVLLVIPYDPLLCVWFLNISVFSMLPLLIKDQLLLPTLILTVFFILIFVLSPLIRMSVVPNNSLLSKTNIYVLGLFYLSLLGCTFITVMISVVTPPKKYPDIFPLLVSVYSCVHFFIFLIYFNIKQWSCKEVKDKHC